MDMDVNYYIGTYYIWSNNRRRLAIRIPHRNFDISSARSALIPIDRSVLETTSRTRYLDNLITIYPYWTKSYTNTI